MIPAVQTPFRAAIPVAFARRVALTRAETAETLGVSEASVDRLIRSNKLHASHVGSAVRVLASDVWALMGLAPAVVIVPPEVRSLADDLGL